MKVEANLNSKVLVFTIMFIATGLGLTSCQPLVVQENRLVPSFTPSRLDKVSWLKSSFARKGGGRDERMTEVSALVEPFIADSLAARGITINASEAPADWRLDYRLVATFVPSKDAGQPEVEEAPRLHDPVGTGFDLRGDSSNRAPGVWTYQFHITAYGGFQEKAVWFGRVDDITAPDGVQALPKGKIKAAVNQLIATLFKELK